MFVSYYMCGVMCDVSINRLHYAADVNTLHVHPLSIVIALCTHLFPGVVRDLLVYADDPGEHDL